MRNLEFFQGVYPFVVTPMHARSQDVDRNRLRSHIDDLIKQGGVHGITVLGSTGEFPLLSKDERREVAEVVVDAVGKRVPVVVGTSAIATRTAVAMSRHAAQAGADGWTTGIANTIPKQCVDVFNKAFRHGRWEKARQAFMRIVPLCDFFAAKSLTRAAKAAAELMGNSLAPPRLPLRPLGKAYSAALRDLLADLGLVKGSRAGTP